MGETEIKEGDHVSSKSRGVIGDAKIVDLDIVVADMMLVQPVKGREELLKEVEAQGLTQTDLHRLVEFGHDEHGQGGCEEEFVEVDNVRMPSGTIVSHTAVRTVSVDLFRARELVHQHA